MAHTGPIHGHDGRKSVTSVFTSNKFSVTSMGLLMVSRAAYGLCIDATTQVVRPNKRQAPSEDMDAEEDPSAAQQPVSSSEPFSWRRSLRYAGVGSLYLAPLEYVEWVGVTRCFPGTSLATAVAKTAVDMLVLHPFNCLTAMSLNQALASDFDGAAVVAKLRQDFWHLQTRLWMLRPVIEIATFVSFKGVVAQMLFMGAIYFVIDIWVNEQVNRPVISEETAGGPVAHPGDSPGAGGGGVILVDPLGEGDGQQQPGAASPKDGAADLEGSDDGGDLAQPPGRTPPGRAAAVLRRRRRRAPSAVCSCSSSSSSSSVGHSDSDPDEAPPRCAAPAQARSAASLFGRPTKCGAAALLHALGADFSMTAGPGMASAPRTAPAAALLGKSPMAALQSTRWWPAARPSAVASTAQC
eukprot:TRINITY_DN21442_c0_g1_i1.p1 TRINITY_DN21442_c0_g1~~TRINITY_DN21442_c0_g1_i1.p1  ORF type:complete len:434 (+),score=97.00 TRINITY_DN21442_c0_g1_i1:73-1302(+)